MPKYAMYVDCFSSGLDEMKKKDQKDPVKVLQALSKMKRFSIFEVTENQGIANTMTMLMKRGYIRDTGKGAYPWTYFEITVLGRELMAKASDVISPIPTNQPQEKLL